MNSKLEVKDTGKYGKGIFALKDIKKGEVVCNLLGERIDVSRFAERVNSGKENIDDPFQIGKRTYLDLNNFFRNFNHSCDPNTGIRKNAEMLAIKDIKKGEEVTFDYSLTVAPTEWKMKCDCGVKICRRILGDIRSVPKKRVEEYLKLGVIQDFMRKILKEIGNNTYKIPKYEIEALQKLNKTSNV